MNQAKQSDEDWFKAAKTSDIKYIEENCIKFVGKYSKSGLTALQTAAKYNQPQAVQILAQYEARLRSSKELTALMIAAIQDYVDVVKILAPLESRIVGNNSTAIILAARYGRKAAVEVLLQYEYLWIGQACQSAHISSQFEVANYLQEQIQFPHQLEMTSERQSLVQASGSIGVHDLDNSTQSIVFSQPNISNTTKTTLSSQILENDNVTKYFKFTETARELEIKLQDQIKIAAANQQQNISYMNKIKEQEKLLNKALIQCKSKDVQIKELKETQKQLEKKIQDLIKDKNNLDKQLDTQGAEHKREYNKLCLDLNKEKTQQQKKLNELEQFKQKYSRYEKEKAKLQDEVKKQSLLIRQYQIKYQELEKKYTNGNISIATENIEISQLDQPPQVDVSAHTEQNVQQQAVPDGYAPPFKVKSTNF